MLSPVHYRRRTPRPVSYYALFKWWLLLSQHPGCRGNPTSFRTEHDLGTLAGDLGCCGCKFFESCPNGDRFELFLVHESGGEPPALRRRIIIRF